MQQQQQQEELSEKESWGKWLHSAHKEIGPEDWADYQRESFMLVQRYRRRRSSPSTSATSTTTTSATATATAPAPAQVPAPAPMDYGHHQSTYIPQQPTQLPQQPTQPQTHSFTQLLPMQPPPQQLAFQQPPPQHIPLQQPTQQQTSVTFLPTLPRQPATSRPVVRNNKHITNTYSNMFTL